MRRAGVRQADRRFVCASLAAVIAVAVVSGCSANDDPAIETGAAQQVSDLPKAEGRRAVPISDDIVVVGGGATPNGDGSYSPVYEMWTIGDNRQPIQLPALPADGIVEGLSGVQVGETLVLGGQDCTFGGGEMLLCGARVPTMWTKSEGDSEWEAHPFPEDFLDGVAWSGDTVTGGGELQVFGSVNDRAVLALSGGGRIRFGTFDPGSDEFSVLGDGLASSLSLSATPFCVDADGAVLHARSHSLDPAGDQLEAEEVSLARLQPDGRWEEGPRARLGDLSAHRSVGTMDLACLQERDPLVSIYVTGADPVIASVDQESLGLSPLADVVAGLKGGENQIVSTLPDIVGAQPNGDVLIRSNDQVFALGADGSVAQAGDVDAEASDGGAVLVGDGLLVVDNDTGAVDVE